MPRFAAVVDLPVNNQAPSAARAMVAAALPLWGLGTLADDVELLASELVTNVVVHASQSDTMQLVLDAGPERFRLTIEDGSPVPPRLRASGRTATTGRGLVLVQHLATRWGSEQCGPGKRVWLEIDRNRE
ncbi:MAG: ATP-binding protein [Jatrophihabitans sp.]|uniref:ATP-binding protein n=1 Tax=Jatrophihabitans sp. TaxID=1932789 RepID=UPI003F7EA633